MSKHEDAVRTATARYNETEASHKAARDQVVKTVVAALKAGERPTDVTAWSPFTAAYVRKLARDNGVDAQPR